MAVVYYPKDQLLYSKDTSQGNYEALVLASSPNVVLYFGTASVPTSASALDMPITCSWARSASVSFTYITTTSASVSDTASYVLNAVSSSYASTSSFAINANASPSSSWASQSLSASTALTASYMAPSAPYTTLSTSSLNWITCSFLDAKEFVSFTISASYSFTCSNTPSAGQLSEVSLFISNSAPFTSSLTFPANWIFLGSKPNALTASKCAILSLQSYGPSVQVAGWSPQY